MAIVYTKKPNEDNILFSFNNQILEFYSDSGTNAINAVLEINGVTIEIYPNPNGVFYYNLKNIVNTLIQTNNFKDDLETDLSTEFNYDWTNKLFLNVTVGIAIQLTAGGEIDSLNYDFLSGYINLLDWKKNYPDGDILTDIPKLLQKENGDSYFDYHLNYWYGYPFDLTVYGNDFNTFIFNLTNGLNTNISFNKIDRVVFSDGRTDVSIEDFLPLQNGINDLVFGSNFFNIRLNKITDFCNDGIYIKWINSLGGWNYWLFSKGQEVKKTKGKGFLENDFNNTKYTISPLISLGKESANEIKLQQKRISKNDKIIFDDLLDSTKVYLFAGTPFSQNTFNDWIEVNLKDGSFVVENTKSNLYQFDFTLELPKNNTREI